jgi:microcystin-dependent protein
LNASTNEGAFDSPQDAVPGRPASGIPQYATGSNTTMASGAIGSAGGNRPHDNIPPYVGINFIIALVGLYPSRN